MATFKNEHGVTIHCTEDFTRWSWEESEAEVSAKITVPQAIVDAISSSAVETLFKQMTEDCYIEVRWSEDEGITVDLDVFETDAMFSRSLSAMFDQWIKDSTAAGTFDPDVIPDARKMTEELGAIISRIKAAIPD